MASMELFVYKGQGELPSIDYDCLRTMAYVKLTNAPVKINLQGNPWKSPNGFLPYISIDNRLVAGYDKIINEINEQGYTLKGNTITEQNLSTAYIYLIDDHILPCLQYYLWGDAQNIDNIRAVYATRIRFPFNFYYPSKYVKYVNNRMNIQEQFSIDDKIENHNISDMLLRSKKCLNQLTEKLAVKNVFLSTNYTEFDANLYALLSIIYYIPIANNPLKMHMNECPSLIKYMEKFRKKYLLDIEVCTDPTKIINLKTVSGIIESDDDKYYSKIGPKIFAGFIAAAAMTLFALKQGIFQISTIPSMNDYSIDYDDDNDDDDGDDIGND